MGEARRRKLAGHLPDKTEQKKKKIRIARISIDDSYIMAMALMAGMINRPRLPWVIQQGVRRNRG